MTAERTSTLDSAAVWREFSRRLRAFIAGRVWNAADVDDILQSVYLRIHDRLPSLRSGTRLEAWLYRITRNAIIDFYRARSAAAVMAEAQRGEELAVSDEGDEAREHIGRCLMPMLDELSPDDREAIVLTDLGDATMSEAAARLQLSVPGAKSRVQRARARLRKMFIDCCRVELDARGRAIEMIRRNKCCERDDDESKEK
jgi:RNA polymerase sigma-70 factor (ECF subfamily)